MCSSTASISILPCQAMSRASSSVVGDLVEPSPKRAKVELPSLKDLDLERLTLVDNGPSRNGGKLVQPLLGQSKLWCNLTPQGFVKTPFGFDLSSKFEKPSFLGGAASNARSESLSLTLQIGAEDATILKVIDRTFKEKFAALDKKSQWHELLTEHDKYGSSIKVKIVLAGDGMTQIKLVTADKKIQTIYGWDRLKPYLTENRNFRGSRCKVTVCLTNLWCVSKKAGITLTATHLVLAPPDVVEAAADEDAFDDEELLAELGDF